MNKCLAAFSACLCLAAGCAKVPNGAGIPTTKRVTFSFTLASGVTNPNFVYIVALRPSDSPNPTDQGPVPVVAPPWGNGFVAGNVSYFVQIDLTKPPQQQFTINQFVDANLINYQAIGVPISSTISPDNRVFTFTLDLAQIAPTVDAANAYQSVQTNYLTMNRVPLGNDQGGKAWDALGDSRVPSQINTWITIPLRTSGTYNNSTYGNLEPSGDVADPTLDIVDFQVQVSAR